MRQVKDVRVPENLQRAMAAEAEAARNARAKVVLLIVIMRAKVVVKIITTRAKVVVLIEKNRNELILHISFKGNCCRGGT